MRILHVTRDLDPADGGLVSAAVGLACAQAEAGLAVSLVSTHRAASNLDIAGVLRARGVTVHTVGPTRTPIMWHPDLAKTLSRLIDHADVVHIHALWEEIQHRAALLSRRAGVPHVITPHGMLDPWCMAQSRLRKRIYMKLRLAQDLDRATVLHFTTATERDLAYHLRMKAPSVVEPNGIDLDEFARLPEKGAFRARHPEIGDRPLVLFLGRIHYKKGLDLLIPAFARGAPAGAVLVLAGPCSDDYRAEVEQMIRESRIQDRVIWTGMLLGEQRNQALRDADLFVLPSYQENFGIAVIEALACGTPVLVSDQVNICQEIDEAGVGGVVPVEVEPLAQALADWINDAERRRRAGEQARPFVRERFGWDRIATRWQEHYQALCALSRSRRGAAVNGDGPLARPAAPEVTIHPAAARFNPPALRRRDPAVPS